MREHVGQLTDINEATQPDPWRVGDAPRDFVDAQVRGIVGIEIKILRLEGKWKVSQNRSSADQEGIAKGLSTSGDHHAAMVNLVLRPGESTE